MFSQAARQSAKTAKTTARGLKAIAEAATHAVKAVFAALMAGGGAVFAILILIVGIIGGAAFLGNSQSSEALSAEVLTHTPAIQKYASEFGIPEYVPVIQAIMMQESGGRGTDPMQASECPYNTQYSNTLGVIQDADYSIKVWVQYYADCVWEAGCESPQDLDKLKLSLQGYNYGNGYISWAIRNHGGYSEAKALQFSQEQAAAHGWSGYGDPEYVPHVLRYYSGGGLFAGLFGNGQIVTIAKSLEMKEARSSGHGMDLTAGRNGVPASCPGVQIRQDSFNVALYPSFPFVRMERTGSKTREDGRELAVCQVLVRSSFLTGIMMEHATMWESWNAVTEQPFIP